MQKLQITDKVVDSFFNKQIEEWDTAKHNYEALKGVKVKEFKIGKSTIKVQFNPARIVSSAAKVDAKSLKERKCFLCEDNRPDVQTGLEWDGYTILVNPFPIFPKHLTIPANQHTPQLIANRMEDMMKLAKLLKDYTLFYNGPKCGASAPDHMHFQAGNKGFMPIEHDINNAEKTRVMHSGDAQISIVKGLAESCFLIETASLHSGVTLFTRLYKVLRIPEGEYEPMLNVLCYYSKDMWHIIVFPRKKHRPACYFKEGDDNILISPASVDMGGVFITPLEKDFDKISASDIKEILDEVCISEAEANAIAKEIM